jgi:hypothetical protein
VRWNIVRKERELVVPGSVLARMLHTDKDRTVTIMNDRTGSFGLLRHSEDLHQMTALIAFERHAEQTIGLGDGTWSTIGGQSIGCHRIECEVVRARDWSDWSAPAPEVGASFVGVTTNQEQIPGKRRGIPILASLGPRSFTRCSSSQVHPDIWRAYVHDIGKMRARPSDAQAR